MSQKAQQRVLNKTAETLQSVLWLFDAMEELANESDGFIEWKAQFTGHGIGATVEKDVLFVLEELKLVFPTAANTK